MNHLQFVSLSFSDGSVGIMQIHLKPRLPGSVWPPGYDPETGVRDATDEAIAYEVERSDLKPVGWRRITPDDLPTTRAYRNAWTDNGREIVHDMTKARDIYRDRLRALRKPLLEALDVEYQRADEADDNAAKRAIAARKQALRDAPQDPGIEACGTIAELQQFEMNLQH